jgi:hypothetical protein
MSAGSLRNTVGIALLAGGLITGIAFATAPIAGADKSDDVFRCTDNGGSMKDCCAKGGGDYVKHPNGTEVCTFDDTGSKVARNIDGQLQVVGGEGNPAVPPTRASAVPRPGQQQAPQ